MSFPMVKLTIGTPQNVQLKPLAMSSWYIKTLPAGGVEGVAPNMLNGGVRGSGLTVSPTSPSGGVPNTYAGVPNSAADVIRPTARSSAIVKYTPPIQTFPNVASPSPSATVTGGLPTQSAAVAVGGAALVTTTTAPAALVLAAGYLTLANVSAYGKGTIDLVQANMGAGAAKQALNKANQRYEDALAQKQREAVAIDNARINNSPIPTITPPPFTGGQSLGVTYVVRIEAYYSGVRNGATEGSTSPAQFLLTGPISSITVSETFQTHGGAAAHWTAIGNGEQKSGQFYWGGGGDFPPVVYSYGIRPSVNVNINRLDEQPDAGSLPPSITYSQPPSAPPPYPSSDNWEYGAVEVKVGGNALELSKKLWEGNGLKPFKEPEKQAPLPIAIAPPTPTQEPKITPNTSPSTGLNRTPSGFPAVSEPAKEVNKNLGLIPSMSRPSFTARPFMSGVSDPSEAYEPRDTKTGLTRAELEQQWVKQQQQIQENGKAGERAAALNDAKNIGSIGIPGRSNKITGSMLLMTGVSNIEDLRG